MAVRRFLFPSSAPRPDDRVVTGKRQKFARSDDAERASDASPETDLLLEAAEREGRLLARIAQQEQEIATLRARLAHAEAALERAREHLVVASVHTAQTKPPPPPRPTLVCRVTATDAPEDAEGGSD